MPKRTADTELNKDNADEVEERLQVDGGDGAFPRTKDKDRVIVKATRPSASTTQSSLPSSKVKFDLGVPAAKDVDMQEESKHDAGNVKRQKTEETPAGEKQTTSKTDSEKEPEKEETKEKAEKSAFSSTSSFPTFSAPKSSAMSFGGGTAGGTAGGGTAGGGFSFSTGTFNFGGGSAGTGAATGGGFNFGTSQGGFNFGGGDKNEGGGKMSFSAFANANTSSWGGAGIAANTTLKSQPDTSAVVENPLAGKPAPAMDDNDKTLYDASVTSYILNDKEHWVKCGSGLLKVNTISKDGAAPTGRLLMREEKTPFRVRVNMLMDTDEKHFKWSKKKGSDVFLEVRGISVVEEEPSGVVQLFKCKTSAACDSFMDAIAKAVNELKRSKGALETSSKKDSTSSSSSSSSQKTEKTGGEKEKS